MFRRKEESLFDNEFSEESESFAVVEPASPASATAPAPATIVAPAAASVQPITRPVSNVNAPVSAMNANLSQATSTYRPAPVNNPIPRSAESKPMNPISSQQQSPVKTGSRVLTVGNDILLKGEITTCDRLVIEGKVEATISDVNTVELAECGSFKGSANVVDAQISGLFEGDLIVTGRLVIYASGKVRGNISYGEIEIERGGELSGQIKSVGNGAMSSAPKALNKVAA